MYPLGMCCSKPSISNERPISNKNESASIFTVGCLFTKLLIDPAEAIITKPQSQLQLSLLLHDLPSPLLLSLNPGRTPHPALISDRLLQKKKRLLSIFFYDPLLPVCRAFRQCSCK